MTVIKNAWRDYAERVVPTGAPPIQMQETKRAFYAGAIALWSTIIKSLDADSEPTDADMERMSAINDELQEFVDSLAEESHQ